MNRIKIVYLEDDSNDFEIVRLLLQCEKIAHDIVQVYTEKDFIEAIKNNDIDVIFADYSLPSFNGLEALEIAKKTCANIPFIIISGTLGEELAIDCMKNGATDYILKHRVNRLLPSLKRALQEKKERDRRIQAENELIYQFNFMQILIDTIPNPIVYKGTDGKYRDCNQAFLKFIGVEKENIIGKTVYDIFPKDLADIYSEQDKKLFDEPGVRVFEAPVQNARGEIRDAIYNKASFFDTNGNIEGIVAIIFDITERIKIEQELRKLSRAVEQSSTSIVITDVMGNIEYINQKFTEVSGYSKAEVIGNNPRFLKSNKTPETVYEKLWNTIQSGLEWSGTFCNKKKNGELFWESAVITPVKNSKGLISNFIAIKEDITEKKLLEEQLQQAQKLEAIGRLAGGIAHDFNNLLTVILGFSNFLITDVEEDNPIRHNLEEINKAGVRAANLTRQLLVFSKKQIFDIKVLNLNDIISDLEKMLNRILGEDITLEISLCSNLCNIKADPGQLEQILMNLSVNSRDAMPTGGFLTIKTENYTVNNDDFNTSLKPGEYVCLTVTDDGIGMSKETIKKIFEPFYTTKESGKGTGLGLSTVYGIVKQIEGHISVSSDVNSETIFKIYFPCIHETPEIVKRKISSDITKGDATILVVEDSKGVRTMIKSILDRQGYNVHTADSGDNALEMLKKPEINFDMLITDVIMPEMSGKTVAEEAIKLQSNLKILYVSGYTDDSIIQHGIYEKEINFLQKPFSPTELAIKVKDTLAQY